MNDRPRGCGANGRWMRAGVLIALIACASGVSRVGGGETTLDGFAIPQPGHRFSFPADYGAHPAFKIEWWYITGHLFSESGRRFGFQATFFRLAGAKPTGGVADRGAGDAANVSPGEGDKDSSEPSADFSRSELHLAHMAVTDVKTGQFLHAERLNRAGWDAQAAVGRLAVRNGPWSLAMDPDGALQLAGSVEAEARFRLRLEPVKPIVVFGDNGVSHKGAEPTAASYYLTFPRLRAEGDLAIGDETFRVRGEAWMDHEISSSQLGAQQVGWDWTCIQLADSPWELMLYRLRRADGSADPASKLQWVDPRSRAVTSDYTWKVLQWWVSPRSGGRYPARIELSSTSPATGRPVRMILEPLAPDQELNNSLGGGPYWEGACRVLDAATGKELGSAYLELTGYVKALKM